MTIVQVKYRVKLPTVQFHKMICLHLSERSNGDNIVVVSVAFDDVKIKAKIVYTLRSCVQLWHHGSYKTALGMDH